MIRQERLLKIIQGVRTTEKTARLQNSHQYVFRVVLDATKIEIKAAVEQLFSVEVDSIGIVNLKAKMRRVGAIVGSRKKWKKAYVVLKKGHHIQVIAEAATNAVPVESV